MTPEVIQACVVELGPRWAVVDVLPLSAFLVAAFTVAVVALIACSVDRDPLM